MTRPDFEAMLSLRHATEVTDPKSVTELAATADDDTSDPIAGR